MFKDDAPAIATQVVNGRAQTQGSAAGQGSYGSSSSMPPSAQGTSQPPVRADSKYAKVRRRLGASALSLAEEAAAKSDREEDAPPAKRIKSFDPDVESATSQVQERFRKQQLAREAESLAQVIEEEDDFAAPQPKKATLATSKKKAVEPEPESDEEATRAATFRKKGTQASASQAAIKKGKAAEATQTNPQPAYLQVNTGRRKIAKAEMEINDEFNKLKIKKPVAAEAHKMGWNERDVLQDEMNEDVAADWQPNDKSTFFQIKYVSMVRPGGKQPARAAPPASIDPKYAGKPNFKAFRPKTGQPAPVQRATRPQISLVVQEPLGYGLRESYGQDNAEESEEDIVMPIQNATTKRTKRTAKTKAWQQQSQKAPPAAKPNPKAKKAVITSESDEEQEEEESEGSAAQAPPRTARAKETITIDSDSDDADGKTFGGRRVALDSCERADFACDRLQQDSIYSTAEEIDRCIIENPATHARGSARACKLKPCHLIHFPRRLWCNLHMAESCPDGQVPEALRFLPDTRSDVGSSANCQKAIRYECCRQLSLAPATRPLCNCY